MQPHTSQSNTCLEKLLQPGNKVQTAVTLTFIVVKIKTLEVGKIMTTAKTSTTIRRSTEISFGQLSANILCDFYSNIKSIGHEADNTMHISDFCVSAECIISTYLRLKFVHYSTHV
jgi:hypothetical protein